MAPTQPAPRASVATGRNGMVVSGSRESTEVAARLLAGGANVVDAAIAGAAALAVTQPQACTLGGDAFILVHDAARGQTEGLNASGPSPRLALRSAFGNEIPQRGARSVNVPGIVAGWHALHVRYGARPWRELLAPAIDLARDGVAASAGFARATEVFAQALDADPGSRALFRPNGASIAAGATFRQPALAGTLEAIAAGGPEAFYEGAIAASLAATCERLGGYLRASDFSGYRPEWVTPAEVHYRGHRVVAMPPNSYGLYLLLQLLALEDAPPLAMNSPERFATLVRAAQAAFAVGSRAVADPRCGAEPHAPLLGEAGRERLRAAAVARPPNRGGTAVISVVDAIGNAVTIVQSVFMVFGSAVVDPDTGILLSDRMIGFNLEAGHPNELAPGKRPAHTLCPVLAFRPDGRLRYAMGTPGGPGQTITLAQVLQATLDAGVPLEDAIAEPRWSMDLESKVVVGRDMAAATVEAIRLRGIEAQLAPPDSPFFGSAEAIERMADGTLKGVADFRRDAFVRGE